MTEDARAFHEMDDGATEVVELRPQHREPEALDVAKIAASPVGGGLASLSQAGAVHRRDFIILRSQAGAIRIALPHVVIYRALLALWTAKRAEGVDDPGVAIGEIVEHVTKGGGVLATTTVSGALRSLTRNGAARSTDQYVGWRGRRTRYYPTSIGAQAFAIAELMGDGSLVQVGRASSAWRSRDEGQPMTLFQHAARLNRGREIVPGPTPVESA